MKNKITYLTEAPSGGKKVSEAPSGGKKVSNSPSGGKNVTNSPSGGRVDITSFEKNTDGTYIKFKKDLLDKDFKQGDITKCDTLKTSEYDKKYYYIKVGKYKGCFYKKKKSSSGGSNITPSPGTGGAYTDCTGESRQRGCKDTDGLIKKVQACIGVVPDGKFGPKTEAKLKEKTGKSSFESNEVEGICSGKITPEGGGVFGPEQQKEYWTKLKTDGQIYEGGIAKKLSNAQKYVYIIKRKKDGTKVPMSSEAEVSATTDAEKQKLIKSFDEFDYEVLYPIEPSAKVKRGEVGILTAGIDQNDKLFVKIMKDPRGFWEPAEVEEKFEMETPETLAERVIKKVLKLRLFEQKVNRSISSSSDPKKDYTYKEPDVTQSTTTTTTTTTTKPEEKPGGVTTDIKIDEKKIKDDLVVSVFKERRRRVLEILKTEIDEDDGYSSELVEPYKVLLNMSPETYCDPQNIKTLNNSLAKIEKRKGFVFGETKDALLEVERILKTIETDCGRIEQKVQSEVKRLKAEKTKTTSSSTQPSGGKPSDTKPSDTKPSDSKPSGVTDEKPQDVIDPEVKSFVEEMGFTFEKPTLSEKDRLATRTTVGEQLRNLDTDGIYREYYMDRTPIWKGFESQSITPDIKSTLSDIKSNIPKEQKKSACRKAINQLFAAAFPPAKTRERETRQVIDNDTVLDTLKTAIIRCDEEHNFPDNNGGDEIKALYECRNNNKKRSYYGISRYCLKDFKPLKQDNPMMQRESIIRRHIVGAIRNKKQEVMVESIIRKIKNLR